MYIPNDNTQNYFCRLKFVVVKPTNFETFVINSSMSPLSLAYEFFPRCLEPIAKKYVLNSGVLTVWPGECNPEGMKTGIHNFNKKVGVTFLYTSQTHADGFKSCRTS